MSGANGSTDSGGSHSLGMSKVQNGESNARGDNPVSKTHKTSRRQARKKGFQEDSCNIQKNVNMTIKDGLKKLKELVAVIERV